MKECWKQYFRGQRIARKYKYRHYGYADFVTGRWISKNVNPSLWLSFCAGWNSV